MSHAQVPTRITSSGLNTQVGAPTPLPNGQITYDITGGTRSRNGMGPNLFHSFGELTVGRTPGADGVVRNDIANFFNDSGLGTTNILGRVTDGVASEIYGTIQTTGFGNANLYLMNPAGIIFGPTASLNVGGSVAFTTANYLRLADEARFYADIGQESTLTSAPVTAFGFLGPTAAPISVQQSSLSVPTDQTLSLVGGNITITGSGNAEALSAPSGRINLASVASAGEVIPNSLGEAPNLQLMSYDRLGDITLSNGGSAVLVQAGGDGGGTVIIRGGRLMMDDAEIAASTKGPAAGALVGEAGAGIDIQVMDNVLLDNGSFVSTNVFSGVAPGIGSGGVRLKANDVEIRNGSAIDSTVFFGSTGGKSGNIEVDANNVFIRDGGFIRANTGGSADGGALILNVNESLELRNGGLAFTLAFAGSGNAGDIVVNANDILLTGAPGVITGITSQTGTTGSAGDVSVTAQNLRLLGNATFISSPTFGPGQGGNLDVNVAGELFMSGTAANPFNTGLFATSFGTGKAGNLNISADSITFVNRARAQATTFGPGDAGNVTVRTGSLELRDGSSIGASAVFGTGKGGTVDVTAETILIVGVSSSTNPVSGQDFTGISTATNAGPGGDMRIAADHVTVTDKGQITSVSIGPGAAGNMTLQLKGSLELTNGGEIISSAFGSGPGGKIDITALKHVLISGVNPVPIIDPQLGPNLMVSAIASQYASAVPGGTAGDIQITTGSLQVLDGGKVAANTFGPGNGGDITVRADSVSVAGLNAALRDFAISQGTDPRAAGSSIESSTESGAFGSAATGAGGSIQIQSDDLQVTDRGFISARTSSLGAGGNIELTADRVSVSGGGFVSAESTGTVSGAGNAGSVSITAPNKFQSDGGQLTTSSAQALGGDITITAGKAVELTNGAVISASSSGPGNAGNITIDAGQTFFSQNSSVTTQATQAGGGDISVMAGDMVRLINSQINTSVAGGTGGGGNITIDPNFVILQNSQILAQAFQGAGGNINITAGVFLADTFSLVDASSQFGLSGTVTIQSPTSNLSSVWARLQQNYADVAALVRARCAAQVSGQYSSFVQTGRDAIPLEPGGWLLSPMAALSAGEGPEARGEGARSVVASSVLASEGGILSLRGFDQNLSWPGLGQMPRRFVSILDSACGS